MQAEIEKAVEFFKQLEKKKRLVVDIKRRLIAQNMLEEIKIKNN